MTANAVSSPTGTLMRNTQRQLKLSVIQPPMVGPSTGATTVAIADTANALLRCEGSNVSRMIDCWTGCSPPPNNPCKMRNTISCHSCVDIPHKNEQTENAAMHSTK